MAIDMPRSVVIDVCCAVDAEDATPAAPTAIENVKGRAADPRFAGDGAGAGCGHSADRHTAFASPPAVRRDGHISDLDAGRDGWKHGQEVGGTNRAEDVGMNYIGLGFTTICLLSACVPAAGSGDTSETGSTAAPPASSSGTGDEQPTTAGSEAADDTTGAGDESSGGQNSSTGDDPQNDTDVDTSTTTGEEPPPVGPFTCMDARWVFVGSEPRYVRALGPDPRGHVLGHTELELLDVDADGALAIARDFADGTPYWTTAGPDAAGNWFKTSVDDDAMRRRWVQKFDVDGALVWEVDLGLPGNDNNLDVMAITVAPNGAIVLTDGEYVMRKLDAAGTVVWTVPDYLVVQAMNDAGDIAAIRPGDDPGAQILNPDGSHRWNLVWDGADYLNGRIDINATGEVLLGSTFAGAAIQRLTAAGAPVWHDWDVGGPFKLAQLAMNDAGEIVLGGYSFPDDSALIMRLDAAGSVIATHKCNVGSAVTSVNIDNDGVMYVGGNVDMSTSLPFIAVFDKP